MAKAKITVNVSREIELKPEYYPEGWTVEQMLEQEINYANEMFHEFIDGDGVEFSEAQGEIVD